MTSLILVAAAAAGGFCGAMYYKRKYASSKDKCLAYMLEHSERNQALLALNETYNFSLDIDDPILLYGNDSDYDLEQQKYSFRHCLKRHVQADPDRYRTLLDTTAMNREIYASYQEDLQTLPHFLTESTVKKAGLSYAVVHELEEAAVERNELHPVTVLRVAVEMQGKGDVTRKEYLAADIADCLDEL